MPYPWRELLPISVEVGGAEYAIRSDYRAALDICAALSDPELDGRERAAVALEVFYPDVDAIPPERYEEAVERCLWFLGGGTEEPPQKEAGVGPCEAQPEGGDIQPQEEGAPAALSA